MKKFAWESTPLVNFAYNEESLRPRWDKVKDDLLKLGFVSAKVGSKDFLIGKLRSQDYCWTHLYDGRMHIWETANWRAFARNGHGISFEVRADLDGARALDAWDDFKRRIRLDAEVNPLDIHRKAKFFNEH